MTRLLSVSFSEERNFELDVFTTRALRRVPDFLVLLRLKPATNLDGSSVPPSPAIPSAASSTNKAAQETHSNTGGTGRIITSADISKYASRSAEKKHYNLIPLSATQQFKHNIGTFLTSALGITSKLHMAQDPTGAETGAEAEPKVGVQSLSSAQTRTPGLKKIAPYWYAYTTMAKERWMGREVLEMVSTEFRDRSMEYYVCLSLTLPLTSSDAGLTFGGDDRGSHWSRV